MTIAPVRKQIIVEATQERAFRVFTEQVDRWWPRSHHIGKSPLKKAVLEPRLGGRWYSTCEDGSECSVGKVLAWEPPGRVLLAWQITAQWTFDPAFMTEVEVIFIADGPTRTRVELEHRNLERYGEGASAVRTSIDAPGGWGLILSEFARVAAEG